MPVMTKLLTHDEITNLKKRKAKCQINIFISDKL